jgi:hypothetical protein
MTETPTAAAQAWLAGLDGALQRRDVDGALDLSEDESYWHDFVAFTWNLKTLRRPPWTCRSWCSRRSTCAAPLLRPRPPHMIRMVQEGKVASNRSSLAGSRWRTWWSRASTP